MKFARKLLQHPLTKGMDLDDPNTTTLRKQIIQEKPLLTGIYQEWYRIVRKHLPVGKGPVLEIGSGAGFMKEYVPELISSDIMPITQNDVACNAQHLPFRDNCLQAIVLVNVLHHISNPLQFFIEAGRCIRKNGKVIMIEPWVSSWSRIVYGRLHHEPFDLNSSTWNLPQSGPLSGGNDALPWIIFNRDRRHFEGLTNWQVRLIEKMMPFSYLLSGGVSMRNLVPKWLVKPLFTLEKSMSPRLMKKTAMFAVVVLTKNDTNTKLISGSSEHNGKEN